MYFILVTIPHSYPTRLSSDLVAQHAGPVVVRPAFADRQGLGHGDLHVIDVAMVPDRLEQRVGEAEHEQVLHRLFAKVVVDAIDRKSTRLNSSHEKISYDVFCV